MNLLVTNLYIFLLAVTLAILEIQIEGAHGWAERLPAWRPTRTHWSSRLVWKLLTKELTGYHLALVILLLLFFHFPFILGVQFTLENEVKILSFFFIFAALWDFLWFVLNPNFTVERFKAAYITWHRNWLLGLPTDYYGCLMLSLLVIAPLYVLGLDTSIYYWWLFNILLFLIETLTVMAVMLLQKN